MFKNAEQVAVVHSIAPAQLYVSTHGVSIGGIYKHRNGNLYKVLHVACSTEDLSWSVIYEALYKNTVSQIWSRNLEDFLAIITLEDGVQQPRFTYQEQEAMLEAKL